MPTYEFRCPKGHEFEKFYRSMSAAQLQVPCPTCGKTAERQVSAGAGLVFKGTGFYITDYGKDGKKAATSGESPGTKESTSSGTDAGAAKGEPSGKSEKPAVKAEPKAATESKPSGDSRTAVASKSAAKKSSARKKSGE
ncbi:MAG TPA: zinc ribbon domain-containing protein [Gemmatimonadaceae bacterium]|nr:zinc ribbon domain-containing protein [Gemmatimonadaceae bacterium]